MTPDLIYQSKRRETANSNPDLRQLIEQLNAIKIRFETEYYGQKPLGTYDLARNFSIKLNAKLFEMNSMVAEPDFSGYDLPISKSDKANFYRQKFKKISNQDNTNLHAEIQNLRYELMDLINH